MNILAINCGSSSIKYKLIDITSETELLGGNIERIGAEKTHKQGIQEILAAIADWKIDAVGHRVVHGGIEFHRSALIDDAVIEKIRSCIPLAPLHNAIDLDGILAARHALPKIPHVAVFDTSFHAAMPRKSYTYGVSQEMAAKHNLRKFGFHGISHKYINQMAARYLRSDVYSLRVVSCHLGSGSSTCAIAYGRSVDTSMGRTPLEGLLMGTRSGDLDPSIILQLVEEFGGDLKRVDDYLNKECGLKGIAGDNDLRTLEQRAAGGDRNAGLAIQVYAHRVRRYIGSHFVTLGGCDAIVLTGGIGENSPSMRQRILQRLDFMGLSLDESANGQARLSDEQPVQRISTQQSLITALVVKTDEELEIARETRLLLRASAQTQTASFGVVARSPHVHLNLKTFERLFGHPGMLDVDEKNTAPDHFRVDLVGPLGSKEGIQVLLPLREDNQVEIDHSDEMLLGIDVPLRVPGNTKYSAGVELCGPLGRVQLAKSLITPWKHLLLNAQDLANSQLKDRSLVDLELFSEDQRIRVRDVVIRATKGSTSVLRLTNYEAINLGLPVSDSVKTISQQVQGWSARIIQ